MPRRTSATLSLSVTREVLAYTLLSLGVVALVLAARKLLRYLPLFLGSTPALEELGTVVALFLSVITIGILPFTLLHGVLLAYARGSADGEILAMRASGLGLRQIVQPVLILGLAFSGFVAYLTLEIEPLARQKLRGMLKNRMTEHILHEPGRFQSIGSLVFLVGEVDSSQQLRQVFVRDEGSPDAPVSIFAERGRAVLDVDTGTLTLRLEEGRLLVEDGRDRVAPARHMAFRVLEYPIDVDALLATDLPRLRPKEMRQDQLRQIISASQRGESLEHLIESDSAEYHLELNERYASAFAPAALALIAVPLAVRTSRGTRARATFVCGLIALGYHALLVACRMLAVDSLLPAFLAPWIPVAALSLAGIWALGRSRSTRAGLGGTRSLQG